MPRLVQACLRGLPEEHAVSYDAILVDEGQDYLPLWWATLRQALRPGGEMMLVADPTQDVYGHNSSWTDAAMVGAGFRGPWNSMETCYRLPATLAAKAVDFAREFIEDDDILLPEPPLEGELALELLTCEGSDNPRGACEKAVRQAWAMVARVPPRADSWTDVSILVQTRDQGRRVKAALEARKVKPIHTFAREDDVSWISTERRLKLQFFKGAAQSR